jgi:hypothetical protein
MFNADPDRYAWAGMATYASGIVGKYMLFIYGQAEGVDVVQQINLLGRINFSIYEDLYWMFMADQAKRLEKIKELKTFKKFRNKEFHGGYNS